MQSFSQHMSAEIYLPHIMEIFFVNEYALQRIPNLGNNFLLNNRILYCVREKQHICHLLIV